MIAPDTNRLREIQSRINRREDDRRAAGRRDDHREHRARAGTRRGTPGGRGARPADDRRPSTRAICKVRRPSSFTFPAWRRFARPARPIRPSSTLRDELAETERTLEELTASVRHPRPGGASAAARSGGQRWTSRFPTRGCAAKRSWAIAGWKRFEQDRAAAAEAVEEDARRASPIWAERPRTPIGSTPTLAGSNEAFVADVEKAESRRDSASAALAAAEKEQARRQEKLAATVARVRDLRKRLDERTADGRDDAEREAELTQRAMEFTRGQGPRRGRRGTNSRRSPEIRAATSILWSVDWTTRARELRDAVEAVGPRGRPAPADRRRRPLLEAGRGGGNDRRGCGNRSPPSSSRNDAIRLL